MDQDALWKRPRADLLIPEGRGEHDLYLWEHSWRIARSAERIASFAEVARHHPDIPAVIAGALYHAAGWAARYRDGECERTEIFMASLHEGDREESVLMLEKTLGGVLSADSMQRAARAVRTQHERGAASIEARIVADARCLQEFGVLSLWPMIRRGMSEGKAVQALLDAWNRKKEYHFWEARLADSFHFESVRRLAGARLEQLERIIGEVKAQHYGEDVNEVTMSNEPLHPTHRRVNS